MRTNEGAGNGEYAGSKRFTDKQKAILSAHFNAGMRGVGELYSSRVQSAAREAGLQIDQVKVCST